MNEKRRTMQDLAVAAMMLALGYVLPFFTGNIPQIGSMLLPMHLPVLLCGLICGWQYPFPTGIAMAFELAAYGSIAGSLYARSRWQCVAALYRCLIAAMIGGRVVWAAVRVVLSGVSGQAFTWQMFLSGALLTAIPGILLQLAFIPLMMVALDRTGLVRFRRSQKAAQVL